MFRIISCAVLSNSRRRRPLSYYLFCAVVCSAVFACVLKGLSSPGVCAIDSRIFSSCAQHIEHNLIWKVMFWETEREDSQPNGTNSLSDILCEKIFVFCFCVSLLAETEVNWKMFWDFSITEVNPHLKRTADRSKRRRMCDKYPVYSRDNCSLNAIINNLLNCFVYLTIISDIMTDIKGL